MASFPTADDFRFVVIRPLTWAAPRYAAVQGKSVAELEGFWSELGIDGWKYRGVGRPSLRALAEDESREVAGWGHDLDTRLAALADYQDGTVDDEEFEARFLLRGICSEQKSVLAGGSEALTAMLGKIEEPEWEVVCVSSSETVGPQTLGFDLGWAPNEMDDPFYSVVSDCAILPLWHGPPDDVIDELRRRLSGLNDHQLFESYAEAEGFRAWYDETDWGEKGGFEIWRIDAAPIVQPPPTLDGARTILWAIVEGNDTTGATRHFGSLTTWDQSEVTGAFSRITICEYEQGGSYLFYCNDMWQVVTDTLHDSVEEAKDQAAKEYARTIEWLEVSPDLVRRPCPCCGFLTFRGDPPDDPDDPGARCPVCGWISDFVQNTNPKASGMPNMYSLEQSQRNVREAGAAIPGDLQVRPPLPIEIPEGAT